MPEGEDTMTHCSELDKKAEAGAGGGARVVEHLPRKCGALSSNPSAIKKQEKKSQKVGETGLGSTAGPWNG